MLDLEELWYTIAFEPGPLGAVAMRKLRSDCSDQDGLAALSLMEQAQALLDRSDSFLEAGPHLDLAICRLRDALAMVTLAEPAHCAASQNGDAISRRRTAG